MTNFTLFESFAKPLALKERNSSKVRPRWFELTELTRPSKSIGARRERHGVIPLARGIFGA